MGNNMLRRMPVERATGQLYGGRHRLHVVYKTRDLVVLGLGVMIGAGIFRISGVQAATMAGPAVILSFVVAGIVCLLAALSYAELSSIIPVAGSAYSFTYVTFGEVWAWIVGWSVVLELLLAASVVARAWSLFATQALDDFGVVIPSSLSGVIGQEKGFDLFALLILLLLILLLATGARLSLKALWFMVLAKLFVISMIITGGLRFFRTANLTPFVPPSRAAANPAGHTVLDAVLGGTSHVFGYWGIFAAAPTIAFAYVGFDLITTTAEETEDAPRRVPRGMLISLLLAIVLYIVVAVTMVGMISYKDLDPSKSPFAVAFAAVGAASMSRVVDIGAVLGLTTVILVVLISLTRVIFSMGRDGLLPVGFGEVSSRWRVPSRATLLAGGATVLMSQTVDVLTLEQMVVLGTLMAFLFVSAGVLALRRDRPDLQRPFRVPAAPLTPLLAIVATAWLMLNLKVETWEYFSIWMTAGIALYLAYGRRRSRLREFLATPRPAPASRPLPRPAAPYYLSHYPQTSQPAPQGPHGPHPAGPPPPGAWPQAPGPPSSGPNPPGADPGPYGQP
ncbi:MAG: basic amino acid/polyamine antiporter, family [Streptosporangiaceae bacterium]|nr:basic amino acid/polyamine antiporter, family [Streptosporangiaceae bacterium]